MVTWRASTNLPFDPPTPVHELDTAVGEYPAWISPDLCRLYITRRVDGQGPLRRIAVALVWRSVCAVYVGRIAIWVPLAAPA
jgi:hypothetical protein